MRFLAYIDPGSGSFALQAAIGALMGVSFAVRNRVRGLFSRFKKSSGSEKTEK